MAARIIAGTLGGAMSAFAIVKSTTVTANQTDKKALTTIFYHEDNAVATQDVQLTKWVFTHFIFQDENTFFNFNIFIFRK